MPDRVKLFADTAEKINFRFILLLQCEKGEIGCLKKK